MPDTTAPQQRLLDIERLKGLGIVLVVWAHVYDADFPAWALAQRQAIYAFHMPLFMFLSGFVFIYSGAHQYSGSLLSYTRRRANRLLIPFIVMAIVVLGGKFLAQQVIDVHKPVNNIIDSFANIFFYTEKSPVLFIWYVIILFYFSIITVFIRKKINISVRNIFIISIMMHIFHVILFYNNIILDFIYFNRILFYYIFFMAGGFACLHREKWLLLVDRFWIAAIPVFFMLEFLLLKSEWRYIFVGFTSMIVFHGLVRSKFFLNDRTFFFLASYAFAIYLLNMLFLGLAKGLLEKRFSPSDHALLTIVVAAGVGIVGPIVVKAVLRRIAIMRPVVRYME